MGRSSSDSNSLSHARSKKTVGVVPLRQRLEIATTDHMLSGIGKITRGIFQLKLLMPGDKVSDKRVVFFTRERASRINQNAARFEITRYIFEYLLLQFA